jgi:hypothetical protein
VKRSQKTPVVPFVIVCEDVKSPSTMPACRVTAKFVALRFAMDNNRSIVVTVGLLAKPVIEHAVNEA